MSFRIEEKLYIKSEHIIDFKEFLIKRSAKKIYHPRVIKSLYFDNLNFDIKSKPYKENIIEVNTILSLVPNQEVKHKISTEINFTTLISIEKKLDDKKELEKIILIKLPTEIYPTLYETFIYLFSQAGVKNITIKKDVDFEKLYNEKTKSQS